uniref:Uncharacterized protein n=1 Tax=Arundo donax TaxID=35708 RepID=A0A0A9AB59_ARUDO
MIIGYCWCAALFCSVKSCLFIMYFLNVLL